ncbi:MAG TPA: hypothetical protein DEB31_11070 [Clostridiales bacterium]|nr:hypothetical protein [Clostridiales bacterium]
MVNITKQVREAVQKSGVAEGSVIVCCPHTTAGITINENSDPDVVTDVLDGLEQIVPKLPYRHDEGNSDAHIKCSLVGISVVLPVEDGEPVLGRWQGIYFCEFDGPRNRRFTVAVNGVR